MKTADMSKQFDEAMFGIYRKAKAEAGYTATTFYRMLSDRGGLDTAKYLINSRKSSDGYTELHMRGRLDLTVEALVVEDQRWRSLFLPEEIERAEKRLADCGYNNETK